MKLRAKFSKCMTSYARERVHGPRITLKISSRDIKTQLHSNTLRATFKPQSYFLT